MLISRWFLISLEGQIGFSHMRARGRRERGPQLQRAVTRRSDSGNGGRPDSWTLGAVKREWQWLRWKGSRSRMLEGVQWHTWEVSPLAGGSTGGCREGKERSRRGLGSMGWNRTDRETHEGPNANGNRALIKDAEEGVEGGGRRGVLKEPGWQHAGCGVRERLPAHPQGRENGNQTHRDDQEALNTVTADVRPPRVWVNGLGTSAEVGGAGVSGEYDEGRTGKPPSADILQAAPF